MNQINSGSEKRVILYQLTQFEEKLSSGNVVTEYEYDFAGNRDKVLVNGVVAKDYTVTNNQIQSVTVDGNIVSYSYDYKGNLTGKGPDTYGWDYKNRLVSANVSGVNIGYKYSSNNLRLAKEKDGETTYYFYNGNNLLCEKDGQGKTTKVYTHDDDPPASYGLRRTGGLLAMTDYVYKIDGSFSHYQLFYYIFDDLGSVTMITNRLGLPVQYYLYDPWGNVTNTENDPVNNFTFVGRYGGWRDWDTGLINFWNRWYDSDDGRWISKDPIGVAGGVNLYGYAGNNGVNYIDWTGNYRVRPWIPWPQIPQIDICSNIINIQQDIECMMEALEKCVRNCMRYKRWEYFTDEKQMHPDAKPVLFGQDLGYQSRETGLFLAGDTGCRLWCLVDSEFREEMCGIKE